MVVEYGCVCNQVVNLMIPHNQKIDFCVCTVEQLKDIGYKWVVLGHSERRHVIGEDDLVRVFECLEVEVSVDFVFGVSSCVMWQTDAICSMIECTTLAFSL